MIFTQAVFHQIGKLVLKERILFRRRQEIVPIIHVQTLAKVAAPFRGSTRSDGRCGIHWRWNRVLSRAGQLPKHLDVPGERRMGGDTIRSESAIPTLQGGTGGTPERPGFFARRTTSNVTRTADKEVSCRRTGGGEESRTLCYGVRYFCACRGMDRDGDGRIFSPTC